MLNPNCSFGLVILPCAWSVEERDKTGANSTSIKNVFFVIAFLLYRHPMNLRTNCGRGIFPSLHHRKEGWLRGRIRSREATLFRADGVVFLFVLNRKTTPASRSAEAPRSLFNRSATPPCGDARRGMTLDSTFVHTFSRPVEWIS